MPGSTSAAAKAAFARKPASARMKAALASARPIVSPLSVSGLNTSLAQRLVTAGAKAGRQILAVPLGAARVVPAADAAAGLGGRGRVLDR